MKQTQILLPIMSQTWRIPGQNILDIILLVKEFVEHMSKGGKDLFWG